MKRNKHDNKYYFSCRGYYLAAVLNMVNKMELMRFKSGDIVSLPLEEMSPELDSKTLDELMIVKRVKFE